MTSAYSPLVIVIGGGTGSGKSALAAQLAATLSPALRVTEDDYYHCATSYPNFDPHTHNFDVPDSKDFALLAAHLEALRAGKTIEAPRYDFATHTRLPAPQTLTPGRAIIVEGLHALGDERVRALTDFSIFVDVSEEVRLSRRLVRDVRERGRDIEGIVSQFLSTVRPMHQRHVEPHRAIADLVVDAERWLPEHLCANVIEALAARRLYSAAADQS